MNELILIQPTRKYSKQIWDLRCELKKEFEKIPGTNNLGLAPTIDEWFNSLEYDDQKSKKIKTTTYLAVRLADDEVIGMVNIRHTLDEELLKYGGNVGYSVKPSERLKGYATIMLKLALDECYEQGINEVLVICSTKNEGSIKTILANGGVLEDEIERGLKKFQRYWINLAVVKNLAV